MEATYGGRAVVNNYAKTTAGEVQVRMRAAARRCRWMGSLQGGRRSASASIRDMIFEPEIIMWFKNSVHLNNYIITPHRPKTRLILLSPWKYLVTYLPAGQLFGLEKVSIRAINPMERSKSSNDNQT